MAAIPINLQSEQITDVPLVLADPELPIDIQRLTTSTQHFFDEAGDFNQGLVQGQNYPGTSKPQLYNGLVAALNVFKLDAPIPVRSGTNLSFNMRATDVSDLRIAGIALANSLWFNGTTPSLPIERFMISVFHNYLIDLQDPWEWLYEMPSFIAAADGSFGVAPMPSDQVAEAESDRENRYPEAFTASAYSDLVGDNGIDFSFYPSWAYHSLKADKTGPDADTFFSADSLVLLTADVNLAVPPRGSVPPIAANYRGGFHNIWSAVSVRQDRLVQFPQQLQSAIEGGDPVQNRNLPHLLPKWNTIFLENGPEVDFQAAHIPFPAGIAPKATDWIELKFGVFGEGLPRAAGFLLVTSTWKAESQSDFVNENNLILCAHSGPITDGSEIEGAITDEDNPKKASNFTAGVFATITADNLPEGLAMTDIAGVVVFVGGRGTSFFIRDMVFVDGN